MGIQRRNDFLKGCIFILSSLDLIIPIIKEFHSSTHERLNKSLHTIKSIFYWKEMRQHVRKFIQECEIFQKNKVGHAKPTGLLSPIQVPRHVWIDISMDFVDGLPTSTGYYTIFVGVDHLSKCSHCIPIKHPYSAINIVHTFFKHVFKLHGIP